MVIAEPIQSAVSHPRTQQFRCADGVHLTVDHYGPRYRSPLLFAHGFGQTRRAWRNGCTDLARSGLSCIAFDARGHGDSDWAPDGRYELEDFTRDALDLVAAQDAPPIWIGASMGGLVGLLAEAARPGSFAALILVDIVPRWEKTGVERILAFMRAHLDGFDDLDQARQAIADYLPHRDPRSDGGNLARMLVRRSDGRLRWHWDPRLLEGVDASPAPYAGSLERAAQTLSLPVLLLSGGRSDVVSEQAAQDFLGLVPHARHQRIARATHMVAGDDNDAFASAIRQFLLDLETQTDTSREFP